MRCTSVILLAFGLAALNYGACVVWFKWNSAKKFTLFIELSKFRVIISVEACDKTSCTPTPTHYEELGCTPVLDEDKCCPIR